MGTVFRGISSRAKIVYNMLKGKLRFVREVPAVLNKNKSVRFHRRNDDFEMYLTTNIDSFLDKLGIWKYVYWRNVRPLFTPDDNYVLFFRDTIKTNEFEPCLIPIVGDQPDTSAFKALMADTVTGVFKDAGIVMSEEANLEWKPDGGNILSFVDNKKSLCYFDCDYDAPFVQKLTGEGISVLEFAWAPDGSMYAIVTDDGVSIVSLGGIVESILKKRCRVTI